MTTPRLGMAEITESQTGKYLTHNDALRVLDALVQGTAQDYTATPPGSPTDGQCWLVAGSATGAWAGQDQKIAQYYDTAWNFISPAAGWTLHNAADGYRYRYTGSAWVADNKVAFVVACSDETTALTAGTAKVTFHMPYAMTVKEVIGSLTTAQTSGSTFTVDVNEAGTSILSTKLTIDNGEETSLTAAAAPVISDSALAKGAKMTIDIDAVGDGTAKGLKVTLVGVLA